MILFSMIFCTSKVSIGEYFTLESTCDDSSLSAFIFSFLPQAPEFSSPLLLSEVDVADTKSQSYRLDATSREPISNLINEIKLRHTQMFFEVIRIINYNYLFYQTFVEHSSCCPCSCVVRTSATLLEFLFQNNWSKINLSE